MSNSRENLFGEALRELRQTSKTRLNTLRDVMDWSKSYLMDLEKGRSAPPKPELVKKLCDAMNRPDKTQEMLRLAAVSRSKIELIIKDASPQKTQTAAVLMRSWGDLDDEKLKLIENIIIEGMENE